MADEDTSTRLDRLEAIVNNILALQRMPLGIGGISEEAGGQSTQSHHHCGGSHASLICYAPEFEAARVNPDPVAKG
jgi:hypothetical protein